MRMFTFRRAARGLKSGLGLLFALLTASIVQAASVAAPTYSPVAGTYTSAQTVTISTTTSGASIRYTTDGSTPSSTAGTLYSSPVSIGATTTLKAIGFKSGSTNSTVTSGTYTINLPVVVAPTFSPAAGTFTSAQTVTIATTTSGASIRYTTDGSTPNATAGTLYAGPVSIGATTTLKAIGFKTGSTNSTVTSGTYTINLPVVAAPTFSPVAGTFTSVQTVTIATTTSGASIRYTTDGTSPSATAGTLYSGPVSIGATATLKAIGFKTGSTNSSVTSGVYTINLPVVAAPTFSPVAGTYTSIQNVTIATTTSGATIRYTTDGSTPTSTVGTVYSNPVSIGATSTLKAIAFKSGSTDSSVTSGAYTINLPVVAAPTFSPAAGTFTSVQNITMATTTSGASIRYTTDGSTPTATAGTLYSGPVTLGATTNLKAIAFKSGSTNSSVTSGAYTLNLPVVATPTFSPAAGTFTSAQTVTIATATSGATIRYTTDGSTPTATVGTIYSAAVSINATTTLKAIAFKSGSANSNVASGTYTLPLGPSVPTGLAPSNVTPASFRLTWLPSSGGSGAITYDVFKNGVLAGNSPIPTFDLTGLLAATAYPVSVLAKDSVGIASAASPSLLVTTAVTGDLAPAVSIVAPATNSILTMPATVNVTATASDGDGTITKVEFFNGAAKLGETATSPYVFSWTPSKPGPIALIARAWDNGGASADSPTVNLEWLAGLPYVSDFEAAQGYTVGAFNGQRGWSVPTGAAQVTNSGAVSGTQNVVLNNGVVAAQVAQEFGPGTTNPTIVFVDFFAKPVAGADETLGSLFDIDEAQILFTYSSGTTAAFSVLDGDGVGGGYWSRKASAVPVASGGVTSAWHRVTVRLNYTTKTWDFYLNGVMYAADLKFRHNTASYFSWFAFRGHTAANARLDNFYVASANPLFADVNDDGIDDAWETAHGISLATNGREGNLDGDAWSNVQEYANRTDPQDYYNGSVNPVTLTLLSGNNQSGAPSQFNAQPFVVSARNTAGTSPLTNAPLVVTVLAGGGQLAASPAGTGAATLNLQTDASGVARIYYKHPAANTTVSQIRVAAGAAQVTFQTSTADGDGDGLPDDYEAAHGLNVAANDADLDLDGDGFTNLQEYRRQTEPDAVDGAIVPLFSIASASVQGPGSSTPRYRPYKAKVIYETKPQYVGALDSDAHRPPDRIEYTYTLATPNAPARVVLDINQIYPQFKIHRHFDFPTTALPLTRFFPLRTPWGISPYEQASNPWAVSSDNFDVYSIPFLDPVITFAANTWYAPPLYQALLWPWDDFGWFYSIIDGSLSFSVDERVPLRGEIPEEKVPVKFWGVIYQVGPPRQGTGDVVGWLTRSRTGGSTYDAPPPMPIAEAAQALRAKPWNFSDFKALKTATAFFENPDLATAQKLKYKFAVAAGATQRIVWSESFTPKGASAPTDVQILSCDPTGSETAVYTIDPLEQGNPHRFPDQEGTYEVKLSQIRSNDRFVTGSFDTAIGLYATGSFEFVNATTNENLGTYKLNGTAGTHVYNSQDEILSDAELDGVLDGGLTSSSLQLTQPVVFWRKTPGSSTVCFSTIFAELGNIEIRVKDGAGVVQQTIRHQLTADSNFASLLDHLATRIQSLEMPAVAPWSLLPPIDGIPDPDDDGGAGAGAAAVAPQGKMASLRTAAAPVGNALIHSVTLSASAHNFLVKVATAADEAVSAAGSTAVYGAKIGGGFIRGLIDGIWDGAKSDVEGIVELGKMGLQSMVGDFHRAKAMWNGIRQLLALNKAGRTALFDSMLGKIVDKAQVSVPWDVTGSNSDQWGEFAYVEGYAGGFIIEQIVTILVGPGLVSKAGNAVKIAIEGTKLGEISATMVNAGRKFTTATFLATSKRVAVYGGTATRAVRKAMDDVAKMAVSQGQLVGEEIATLMERLGVGRITYQQIADRIALSCGSEAEWLIIGTTAQVRLATLSFLLGSNLTESGIRGFLNLWKGALRVGGSGDYLHHLYAVCSANGVLDAVDVARILEMFDTAGNATFKFTPHPTDLTKWISPGGIVYGAGGKEGHRIMHILTHTVAGYKPAPHSIFSLARHAVFELLDEAWSRPHLVAYKADGVTVDAAAFVVDMGTSVGTDGQRLLRIAFEGPKANKVIKSGYPVLTQSP